MLTGLLFALLGMLLNSVAGFLQFDAASQDGPRPNLLAQPRYLAGLAFDGFGWAATVVALRHLPVFAVQAILGASIAVTAIASRFLYGSMLRRIDRVGLGACLAGLVLVASSAAADRPSPVSGTAVLVLCGAAVALGVVLIASRNSTNVPLLAVTAGLAFGGTSLAVRALHHDLAGSDGVSGLLTRPSGYLVIGFWVVGLISYTRALSAGALARVTALFLATEVVFPGLLGILLLGDSVRPGWAVPMAAGLLLAALGVVVLSSSPAQHPRRPGPGPNGRSERGR
ncbi:MAG TPA: hypothetical protein VL595_19310 [Pseudonocardia sp.]|jgi:drug/metabolite transporter (DMT)-like permease|nr:hypothetical protein [Pseudonocardia sp.]